MRIKLRIKIIRRITKKNNHNNNKIKQQKKHEHDTQMKIITIKRESNIRIIMKIIRIIIKQENEDK